MAITGPVSACTPLKQSTNTTPLLMINSHFPQLFMLRQRGCLAPQKRAGPCRLPNTRGAADNVLPEHRPSKEVRG